MSVDLKMEKGKLFERIGRKVTGLSLRGSGLISGAGYGSRTTLLRDMYLDYRPV